MSNKNNETDREALQKIKEKSEDDFEKYITYISAGGLGLSLTFIEKISPFSKSVALFTLVLGWGFLALTLLVNLLSHFYSKKLIDKSIDDIDNNVENLRERIDDRNKRIDRINIGSIITLILGISLLITFVSFNAYNMAKQKESQEKPLQQDYEKRGRTIPKPRENNNQDSSSTNNDKPKKNK